MATGDALDRLRRKYLQNFEQGVPFGHDLPMPKEWPQEHQERMNELKTTHMALLGEDPKDQEKRKKFTENNLRFFGAPAVIFLCLNKTLSSWSLFDLGAFSLSIMLAAQHYGLNTVPAVMMVAYPDLIRQELSIPPELNIAFGIALGYADPDNIENKLKTTRRSINDFARIL